MAVSIIAKRISQKIQARSDLPQIDYPRFLPVQFQSHPLFQLRFDELGHGLGLMPRQNYKIIRVAYQLGLSPLSRSVWAMKHFVEPVQIDIRQQRRDHSPYAKDNLTFERILKYR